MMKKVRSRRKKTRGNKTEETVFFLWGIYRMATPRLNLVVAVVNTLCKSTARSNLFIERSDHNAKLQLSNQRATLLPRKGQRKMVRLPPG